MKKTVIYNFFFGLVWIVNPSAWTAEVIETKLHSDILNKETNIAAIIPTGFNSDEAYPALYLLHGLGGNYRNWIDATDLKNYAENYNFFIVMPDAGKSWYLDSPVVPESQYESYIVEELVPFINTWYNAQNSSYRAICGTSMGGHGAVLLALRHPEIFDAASSLSGALDITAHPDWGDVWGLDSLLSTFEANPENWRENCCYDVLENYSPHFKLFFDCGDADPFVLQDNRRFAARCDSLGIDHLYEEYAGEHKWIYWDSRIEKHLHFHQQNYELTSVKHQNAESVKTNAWPNPFNSNVTITINEPLLSSTVSIYNVYGQKVKSLSVASGQQNVVQWNGANDLGIQSPSGIYFLAFETTTGVKSVKLNYVR